MADKAEKTMQTKQAKRTGQIVLGVTGHPSCGKDTVAEYLVAKYGFFFFSTSDEIRRYIKEHNLGEPTRELMSPTGQKMRLEQGADILARLALEHHHDVPRIILGGIRVLAEADAVKKAGGKMIAVTAPIEVRFERAQKRARAGEGSSFEAFKAIEEKESVAKDAVGQNLNAVVAGADYVINNVGTLEDLYEKIDKIISQYIMPA